MKPNTASSIQFRNNKELIIVSQYCPLTNALNYAISILHRDWKKSPNVIINQLSGYQAMKTYRSMTRAQTQLLETTMVKR